MIGRPATVFATYKASFAAGRRFGRGPRYVTKLVIALATRSESASSILAICEIQLIILVLVQVALLHELIYGLIVDKKLIIALATRFESASPILAICEIQLIILVLVQVALLHGLIYGLIVDNRGIEVINEARCIPWRVGKAGGKCGMASTGPDDVLSEVYSAVIYRIHTSLYSIKLCTELTKAFGDG